MHTLLRPDKHFMAIQMAVKGDAFFCDLSQLSQTEHLKSAAVGKDRALPAGKFVQAAHIAHHLITGSQVHMIGVAQHNLCANLL